MKTSLPSVLVGQALSLSALARRGAACSALLLGISALALAQAPAPAPPAPPAPPSHARNVEIVTPRSPYLGIGVQDIDPDRARALKLKEDRGVEVTSVTSGSPAAKAGVKEGDVILEFNGHDVEGGEQLSRLVRETPIGHEVKLGVWRNGAMVTLTATIEERRGLSYGPWNMPDVNVEIPQIIIPDIPMPRFEYQSRMLGIQGESLGQEPQFAEFFGVKDGVLVKRVLKDSAAEKAGLKAGDVITKIEGASVNSTQDITRVLRGLHGKNSITVTIVRSHKEMPIPVTLQASLPPGVIKADWFVPFPRIIFEQVI